jgi:TolB-like protein/class 3 adenylate cyclase/Flp pilus assembly protein TadD
MAAILAADVAGYSRLMGADEEGTLARLKAHRRELIDLKIAHHRGRIVKTTGDGLLVEFASVIDAVRCATQVQQGMVGRNADVPPTSRIELRIGINLGDIIVDGDDIFGDGVNIAARLEALAAPGGICISRKVREEVRNKLELALEDMGEQQVKNIERPVRVYRIVGSATSPSSPKLALPEKPSIAVLPFDNMSGDPEQEYFADGMVEDIITALARVKWLFVIARNSSFTYKRQAVDVKRVGRELGVRYVLEGSVRKAGNRVRITGQLVDTTTGAHIWADRFDGALDDVFDLQDRVTASVVGTIEPKLRNVEIERARRKPTESLDAYDFYLRALPQFDVSYESNLEALRLLARAREIDPQFPGPYGLAAWCHHVQRARGWVSPNDRVLKEGIRLAKVAAAVGQDDSETLWMAGRVLAELSGDLEGAIGLIDRALVLNPNSANAWRSSGMVLAYRGDTGAAIAHLERAMRLNPLDAAPYLALGFAWAHFVAGNYEEASSWADRVLRQQPDLPTALRVKAATCGLLARPEEGRRWVERLLAVAPGTTISSMRAHHGVFMRKPGCLDAFLRGLREAGLPE